MKEVPRASAGRRRYLLPFIGNMGNCMLQVLTAASLMKRLGPGDIMALDQRVIDVMAPWDLSLPLAKREPQRAFRITGHVDNVETLARTIMDREADDIEIATCNLKMSQYPDLGDARSLFSPREHIDALGFGPDCLVINVRAAETLAGIHRHYTVAPISFYRSLVQQTGLKPVFIGQIGTDIYSEAIKAEFPSATYFVSRSPINDFEVLRRSARIVTCVSTFSLLAAWLSNATEIFMPLLGGFNPMQRTDERHFSADDPRYRFFLFPIFYMDHIDRCFGRLESCLSAWREISAGMLETLVASPPRFRPTKTAMEALFDEAFYLQRYPDVRAAVERGNLTSGAAHFSVAGFAEGRQPCYVDELWYSREYPLAAQEVGQGDFSNFVAHYCEVGQKRGYRLVPMTRGSS